MDHNQLIQTVNLLNVPKIGPQKVLSLLSKFSNFDNLFSMSEKELCSAEGIDQKSAKAIKAYTDFDYGKRIVDNTLSSGIEIVAFWSEEYPTLLKKIYDPPVLLYTKGNALAKQEDAIAIVGTRSATQYGKRVTKELATELSNNSMIIVSGLAHGIDTVAHTATVQNNNRTIAVLGCGIDKIYPSENKKLAEKILDGGTIISEFPIGVKPEAGNFPRRNRIISGISHATIVVEAGNKSGAILTALNAIDQNREVFAVPGRIDDKHSLGCNRLIRNGAIPVKNGKDVIEHIKSRLFTPIAVKQESINLELSDEEREVYKLLTNEPVHIDSLKEESEKSVTQLLNVLLSLELKGAIVQIGGKQFVRN